ncbi:MAG: phage major capsid protein, partial [Hydrogenophaga sp.]|uniref:phage major capsid protein n=1 Tax=Hydrogenophaga sp. TaxID=1904254 RepID=UPI002A364484
SDLFAQVQIPRDLEGRYLFGSPLSPAQGSLWQVPVAQTPSLAAGQFIVLDLAYVTILDRQQLQVLLSEHHKDNFTRNLITMLAELRVGLEVRHSKAVRIATWAAVPPSSSTPPASS